MVSNYYRSIMYTLLTHFSCDHPHFNCSLLVIINTVLDELIVA